jgi:hypothetical protein
VGRWLHGFFYPEDGGDTFPKRRFTQDIPGGTTQKTAFLIVTAVKTSNITKWLMVSTGRFFKREPSVKIVSKNVPTTLIHGVPNNGFVFKNHLV